MMKRMPNIFVSLSLSTANKDIKEFKKIELK